MTARPPRPYQEACVNAVARVVNSGYRSLYYALPTGTGKTRIMTMLVELYRHAGRVLIVAHRKELIEQTAASIREDIEGVTVGIVMAERNECHENITVGTWQSLTPTRLEAVLTAWSEPFSLVLFDESHHAIAGSAYERIADQVRQHSPTVAVVGCTATPFRSDKAKMQDVLPECAFTRSITEMQRDGWLAPIRWKAVRLSMELPKKYSSVDGETDYNQEQLYDAISPQTEEIVQKTYPHFNERPFMAFAVNVQHAHELAASYNLAGFSCMALSAKTPRAIRKDTLDAWKSGAIQGVVNVALFTEGFDYTPLAPNRNGLGVVVIAVPTMSPSRYLQMIGRGTRLKPTGGDFKDCLVFDCASNANLLETRQVTLPKVLPTLQEDVFEVDEFIDFDGEKEAELEKEAGPKKPTILKINDPLATSWLSWGHNHTNDIYYASLSFDAEARENIYAAIVPSQLKDGLYMPYVLASKAGKWDVQAVTTRAKPLGEVMHHVNHVIAASGRKSFVHKDNPKRLERATAKQLNFLVRYPTAYKQAREQAWNKGEVSSMLAWLQLAPQLKKIVVSLRNGSHMAVAAD